MTTKESYQEKHADPISLQQKVANKLDKKINRLPASLKKLIFLSAGIAIGFVCFELILDSTYGDPNSIKVPDAISTPRNIYPDSSSLLFDSLK